MKIKKSILFAIAFMWLVFATGCSVYDDEQDCDTVYKMRFIYDWNMSGGDGFPSQVSSVNLWVFNHDSGLLVANYSDSGEALSQKGYLLNLEGLQPGDYDFIAWCGLEGSKSFSVPSDISTLKDLKCSMRTDVRDGQAVSDSYLSPLFYGSLNNQTVEDVRGETVVYTMYLMKDTNNINISLQHSNDEILDYDDFLIYMTDANANLDFDNSLMSGPVVYYYPWAHNSGYLDPSDDGLNYIKFELSTNRLMADQNPIITIIDKETGASIYSIPIVQWAKVLRSEQNMSMTDQEYLDREHEYTIMLYLVGNEESGGWKAASIVINGYEMR